MSVVTYESIVFLIVLLGCLSFSSSLTAKNGFFAVTVQPTDSKDSRHHKSK